MIIGLTGGIASGKSTAAATLGEWGAYVIDADKLGHRAYEPGTEAFLEVVATFGKEIVSANGEIDRKILGSKVFADGNRLEELTAIVWPVTRRMAEAEIAGVKAETPNRLIVLEAAVLIEAGWQDLVDEVWVVIVEREVAIQRACSRDGVERSAVEARIDAQLSNDERAAHAQEVIDNSGSEAEMVATLKQLWEARA